MFGKSKYDTHIDNDFEYLSVSSCSHEGPEMVLLHGMFGGLSNYDPLLRRMENVHCYVPRIPLYTFEKSELTVPALTEWIRRYIMEMEIERPIILGNSLGGHIALEYAHRYGQEINGLVLTGSSGLMENDLGTTWPRRNDREYIRKQANRTFYEDLADDTLVDEIMEITQSPRKLLKLLCLARSTHSYNMEEILKEIQVPALLVWGRDDCITPPDVAEIFADKLPNARLEWIENCGHAPMMERADEFARHLNKFISERSLSTSKTNSNETTYFNYEENYSYI